MQGTRKNRQAKAKQASKLEEIRAALMAAGFDTTAKQAAVLGVGRSTAWALLNLDKRPVLPPMSSNAFFRRRTFRQSRDEKSRSMSRRRAAACMGIASRGQKRLAINFLT